MTSITKFTDESHYYNSDNQRFLYCTAPDVIDSKMRISLLQSYITATCIMLGTLNESQIENLLQQQVTGRIACHTNGTTYIVPINYVYRDGYIYSHSATGQKIDMMRSNPEICFETDDIASIFKWKSVIAWGHFEEITDLDEKQQAMQSIIHRIMPLVTNTTGHPSHGITDNESDIGDTVELIVYKIKLHKKTGRFELP